MEFTIVKKGYDTNEVDGYVAKTEAKLEEYRKMEETISNSIISAEIVKNKIIAEAEQEAREIVSRAGSEVSSHTAAIKKMLESEKKALDDFCAEYDAIVKTYFTSPAAEITAPLREKLTLLEMAAADAENAPGGAGNGETDPFGEIKNFF